MDYLKVLLICLILVSVTNSKPILLTSNIYGLDMLKPDEKSANVFPKTENVSEKVELLPENEHSMPPPTPHHHDPSTRSLALYLIEAGKNSNEQEAKQFLQEYNHDLANLTNMQAHVVWEYMTNLTDENAKKCVDAELIVTKFNAVAFRTASKFDKNGFSYDTKRQLKKVGKQALSDDEMKNLSSLTSEAEQIYGKGEVCRNDECLKLEPGLTKVMSDSRNASELLWAWQGWRTNVASKIRPLYLQFMELKNKLARLDNYTDYGDELRDRFETPTFEKDVENIYKEMKPLYMELHAYIRRKLYETYGPDVVDLKGTIPQHLLGDMWGRFWSNLYPIAVPFPSRPNLDVTKALLQQNYTVKKMFETGDEFFTSMGFSPVPQTFYTKSMLEKPKDREVVCHASAWDFADKTDFRIKMCTEVSHFDFLTVHHELGHVQYFLQYKDQPEIYRDGANDGFHEAIGDVISMCVSTPTHLHKVGLLDTLLRDNETTINFLLKQSLYTISTMPFHYLNDLWRWKVYRGDFSQNSTLWNDEYWKLSEQLVGVHAPIPRTAEDLDILSIYHVTRDVDMIRYFTRTILQFQFAEALCREAGHEGPLHECDYYRSQAAGKKLAAMMKLGSSKPWPDALETLTGMRSMDVTALRKYFEPLVKWLKETNKANGDVPGWTYKNDKA